MTAADAKTKKKRPWQFDNVSIEGIILKIENVN